MYNLFYTSYAVHPFTQPELEQLLLEAREKNRQNEITGMLLYCEGVFVQLLEGNEEHVRKTFERISTDQRHTRISNVVYSASSDRMFPDWLMGFKNMEPNEIARIEKLENENIRHYFKSSQPYKLIRLMSTKHWTN